MEAIQPPAPRLFPLPHGAVERYFATFAGFDDDQLTLIEGSNTSLADPTDIAYPLLNLYTAPDLLAQVREGHPRAESRVRAFRAGACMGLAIVRGRMDALAEETEESLPPLTFDPRKNYELGVGDDPQLRGWANRLLIGSAASLDEYADASQTLRFIDYLEDETMALHLAHTRLNWLGKMDFTTTLGIESHDDEYINIGLLHAFALANAVEGQPPVAHHELVFAFNPDRHFSIADRLQHWAGGWRLERVGVEFDERELRDGLPDLTPFLRQTLRAGYRAYEVGPIRIVGSDGSAAMKTDKKGALVMGRYDNPFIPDPDIWGSGQVPARRRLTHVRRFESAFVMVDPSHSAELMEVGFTASVEEFELEKDDVVVVRGRGDNFYALPYPFTVQTQASTVPGSCVELFALCRKGQAIYLRDVSDLARSDIDYLHDSLHRVTEFQRPQGRLSLFGRAALHPLTRFGLPPLVTSLVTDSVSGDLWLRQTAGLGSGVGLGVLLAYLGYRRHNPRRFYADGGRESEPQEGLADEQS